MNDSPRNLPALGRDPAFYGYLATQFFGAFNDNLFKQLMLLLAIPPAVVVVNNLIPEAAALPAADLAANAAAGTDVAAGVAAPAGKSMDLQGLATVLFGIPFVIFGGLAGWVADHFSKRNVMVIAKLAEIVIVSLGLCAFLAVPNYGMLGLWSSYSCWAPTAPSLGLASTASCQRCCARTIFQKPTA